MEWINPKEQLPDENKIVLAWSEWDAMPAGSIMWDESKKVRVEGCRMAYMEKNNLWWDAKATINSSPIKVIAWQELPIKPSGGSF